MAVELVPPPRRIVGKLGDYLPYVFFSLEITHRFQKTKF